MSVVTVDCDWRHRIQIEPFRPNQTSLQLSPTPPPRSAFARPDVLACDSQNSSGQGYQWTCSRRSSDWRESLLILTRASNVCAVDRARDTRDSALAFSNSLIARYRCSSLGIV